MIISRASLSEAWALAPALRPEDRTELYIASGGLPVEDSLSLCVERSNVAYIAHSEDGPVMIGGITVRGTIGFVWGVATPLITKNFRQIAALTRPVLRDWFVMFPEVQMMFNQSLTANTVHHRWLKWAGAELFPPVPRGPKGELFTPFIIRRNNYV